MSVFWMFVGFWCGVGVACACMSAASAVAEYRQFQDRDPYEESN